VASATDEDVHRKLRQPPPHPFRGSWATPDAHPPDPLPGQVTTLCFREVGPGGHVGRPNQDGCTFRPWLYPACRGRIAPRSTISVSYAYRPASRGRRTKAARGPYGWPEAVPFL